MGITKGKDGYYRTSIRHQGKIYSVVGKTETEAQRKAGQLKQQLKQGTRLQTKVVTVDEFAQDWLKIYRNSGTKQDKTYARIVNNIIKPTIGHRKISTITERDLQRLLNDNSNYSKSMLSKIKITMKQLFQKAQRNHLIVDNPAEDLKLPQCKEGTHRAITEDERERILETAEKHPAGLYVKIMLYCGLRPNEVDALQWKFIDFKNKRILVRQAVKTGTSEIGLPKTKAGIRDVPIPAQLYDSLVDAYTGNPDGFVCSNRKGNMHTGASRFRMWSSFLRQMDIDGGAKVSKRRIVESTVADDLTMYCLRHTYCTDLQRAGVPINIAKTLMGHGDISVTANIYTHVSEKDTVKAVHNLEQYLDETEEEGENNIIQFPFGRIAK